MSAPRGSWLHPSGCPCPLCEPPGCEVTFGEATNEAVCPPGLGHHCPFGPPKNPHDGRGMGVTGPSQRQTHPLTSGTGTAARRAGFSLVLAFWRGDRPSWLSMPSAGENGRHISRISPTSCLVSYLHQRLLPRFQPSASFPKGVFPRGDKGLSSLGATFTERVSGLTSGSWCPEQHQHVHKPEIQITKASSGCLFPVGRPGYSSPNVFLL